MTHRPGPDTQRAFIFDLDGVIIDSEPRWDIEKSGIFSRLFGPEAPQQIGQPRGLNMDAILEDAAFKVGVPVTAGLRSLFLGEFHKAGDKVYQEAPLTPGVDDLISVIAEEGCPIGLVSAAPRRWIEMAVNRLRLGQHIGLVISLEDRADLRHKPAPDGYAEAITQLGAAPENTIVLEDSNAGISAARSAGAYVVALSQNVPEGYIHVGANAHAAELHDVIDIAKRH